MAYKLNTAYIGKNLNVWWKEALFLHGDILEDINDFCSICLGPTSSTKQLGEQGSSTLVLSNLKNLALHENGEHIALPNAFDTLFFLNNLLMARLHLLNTCLMAYYSFI